jgi:hypothetical protein
MREGVYLKALPYSIRQLCADAKKRDVLVFINIPQTDASGGI